MFYLVMELGSCDLNIFFKKEIEKYKCVREPTRVHYWVKMLQALNAVHKLGNLKDVKILWLHIKNDNIYLVLTLRCYTFWHKAK